jgi:hypothetical protein
MALVLALAFMLGGLYILTLFRRQSSIKGIPGPPSSSWIYGILNSLDLSRQPATLYQEIIWISYSPNAMETTNSNGKGGTALCTG